MTVLPFTAGLADKFAFHLFDRFADRLTIGHLRTPDIRLDAKLTLHAVDDNLQMQFAHPETIVWPDSSSVCRRNDGSSAASRCSAIPIFS